MKLSRVRSKQQKNPQSEQKYWINTQSDAFSGSANPKKNSAISDSESLFFRKSDDPKPYPPPPKAKLVKLAAKLYSLRDLEKATPVGWTKQRVQEYFDWSRKVVACLSETKQKLEKVLDEILQRRLL